MSLAQQSFLRLLRDSESQNCLIYKTSLTSNHSPKSYHKIGRNTNCCLTRSHLWSTDQTEKGT